MKARTQLWAASLIALLFSQVALGATLVRVKDLNLGPDHGIEDYLVGLEDKVFFWGYDGSNGTLGNPFVSDGTSAGTVLILDIMGSAGTFSVFQSPQQIQGVALFAVNDGFSNAQLWRSDGSNAGTFALTNEAGSNGANPQQIFAFGNRAILSAASSACLNLPCLWFSDATAVGTFPAPPGNFFYNQQRFASLHGNVLFTANGIVGQSGPGLYFTDGTTGGTVLISDTLNNVSAVRAFNTQVVFAPSTAAEGIEPWITDGSAGNAQILANINSGNASSSPEFLARVDDLMYFSALQPGSGRELWKTDGTPAGTQLVKDIRSGNLNSDIFDPATIHGRLFFRANNGVNGNELWVSDGTALGTQMLSDINVGAGGSDPVSLTAVNDRLFFSANDGLGHRLWMSDGTGGGTAMLDSDVEVGGKMAQTNGALYVKGYEPATGAELYRLDLLAGGALPLRWCARPNYQIRDNSTITARFKLPAIGRALKGVRVVLDITHPFVSDLTVTLSHVEHSSSALLLDRPGSNCSGDNIDVVLDDAGTSAVQTSCVSAPGNAYVRDASYAPAAALAVFDTQDLSSTWTLQVQDHAAGNIGTLNEWCLDFDRIFFDDFE